MMNNHINNEQKLFRVVADVFDVDVDSLDMTSSPDTVLGWDSLALITLVIELETVFGVQFDILEISNFNNIGTIKKVLSEKGVKF